MAHDWPLIIGLFVAYCCAWYAPDSWRRRGRHGQRTRNTQ